jgi:hypothetical protein
LFADPLAGDDSAAEKRREARRETEERAVSLRERAAHGERETLLEARAVGDASLYDELLNKLVVQADTEDALRALASFVAGRDELRANATLAEALLQLWMRAPDVASTGEMLHVAALSDDAGVYGRALEATLRMWDQGKLHKLSAMNLDALIESEYWLLAPEARSSGAGFVLKRTLADARRHLQTAARRPIFSTDI